MEGLYVHVPFCARACPYCNFDFEVGRNPDVSGFLAGLKREVQLRRECELLPQSFQTVYIGGGTPSLLGAAGLARLCDWISAMFPGSGAVEWTVEINPEHATPALFASLRAHGVSRVSLGVQTLHPHGLVELGRVHSVLQARNAIAEAAKAGLRVSADLILGYRGQLQAALGDDIDALTQSGATHLSIYALTVEPETPWVKLVRRGMREMPDEECQAALLRHAHDYLESQGFTHYEVASYGAGDHRARHNQLYWTWCNYTGIGPSAHSATYENGVVTRRGNTRGLAAWLREPLAQVERLAGEDAAREGLWLGLRQLDGIDVARFLTTFAQVDRAWLERVTRRQVDIGNLAWCVERSVLKVAKGRWLWHDTIAEDVLAGEVAG